MDTRGEHRFSSIMKQNKKAKICAVFCFAGFFFLKFFCYEVIVKQKIYKRCRLYYSHTHTHTHRNAWDDGRDLLAVMAFIVAAMGVLCEIGRRTEETRTGK